MSEFVELAVPPDRDAVELVRQWNCAPEGGGVPLFLYRKARHGGRPVLLLHGASAQHETFTFPSSLPFLKRNLVDWLHERGFDVWLLDWRGSARVVRQAQKDNLPDETWQTFDLDHAATHDVPEALGILEETLEAERHGMPEIRLVGHCLGAAVLAQAIAQGSIDPEVRPTRVVLQAIGLFYRVTQEGQLKSQDRTLEQLLAQPSPPRFIDPHRLEQWPRELRDFYRNWLGTRPHPQADGGSPASAAELCNRLSFMYGAPYLEQNLVPAVHHATAELGFRFARIEPALGDEIFGATSRASGIVSELLHPEGSREAADSDGVLVATHVQGAFRSGEVLEIAGTPVASCSSVRVARADLPRQFGGVPFRLYLHGWRNLQRGWAAGFHAKDGDTSLLDPCARERFHRLDRLLLLTGEQNTLWQRRSIDQMHDWLFEGSVRSKRRWSKRILQGYGHQDLLWGPRASKDVFPLISQALG
jgi:pimeloyl-ACP methyl ester carboxylesterase